MQFVTAVQKNFGTREEIPVEEIFKYIWIPPLGGFFSAATGTGICEMAQPTLERGFKLKTKRANATAILIEATGDWVITILNLNAGLIRWDIWLFSGMGVIIGGQIGPYISRFMPDRLLKIIFSIAVLIVGSFYIYKGILWILTTYGII
jgi:uncharacterized membrane protein YfcA